MKWLKFKLLATFLFQEFACPRSSDEITDAHQVKTNEVWGTDLERNFNSQVLKKTGRISKSNDSPMSQSQQIPEPLHAKLKKDVNLLSDNSVVNRKQESQYKELNSQLTSQKRASTEHKLKEVEIDTKSNHTGPTNSIRSKAQVEHVIFTTESIETQNAKELSFNPVEKMKKKIADSSRVQSEQNAEVEKEISVPEDVVQRNETFVKEVRLKDKPEPENTGGTIKSMFFKLFGKK